MDFLYTDLLFCLSIAIALTSQLLPESQPAALNLEFITPFMADAVLDRLSARNIFDLSGVVAVVTGGGSVRFFLLAHSRRTLSILF